MQRIERVEAGLRERLADPPWKTMDLTDRMAYYAVPGLSIAVIDDGRVAWAKGYGLLETGGSRAVTPETLFQPGSIGKPMVALATLQLVESGLLDLDQDISQQLTSWQIPENPFTATRKVTLRRLLSHSAGVTVGGFVGYRQGAPLPDLQQVLDGMPPANSPPIVVDLMPGTQERYSGGGYMIVQQLLEDVTGQPLPELMQQLVLDPLGMDASTFIWPLPEEMRPAAARGHRASGAAIPGGWHIYPEAGAGASLWSTPTDVARFAIDLTNSYNGEGDSLLSHAMSMEMLTPLINDRGLGLLVYDDGADRFYFMHPGANDGYKSVLVVYPERRQGVVIMTNSDAGDQLWREVLNSVSVEYGWTRDRTWLYAGILAGIIAVALGVLTRYRRGSKSGPRPEEPSELDAG